MIASVPPLVKTISSSLRGVEEFLHRAARGFIARRSPRRKDNARRDGHWRIRWSRNRASHPAPARLLRRSAAVEIDQAACHRLRATGFRNRRAPQTGSKAAAILPAAVMMRPPWRAAAPLRRRARPRRGWSSSAICRHGVFQEGAMQQTARLGFRECRGRADRTANPHPDRPPPRHGRI